MTARAVVENGTGKALYYWPFSASVVLDENGMSGVVRALDITSVAHSIVDTDEIPGTFVGGAWAWDGSSWSVIDQARIEENEQAQLGAWRETAEVSPAQAEIILNRLNKLTTLYAVLDAPGNEEAKIRWQRSTAIHRTHPDILALAPALSLSETDLDDLFKAAAALE